MQFNVPQSSAFLNPPPAPYRKSSKRSQRPHDEIDDFLSSDLELSFASTVSLISPEVSPSSQHPSNQNILADSSVIPMDISPVRTSSPVKQVNDRSSAKSFNRPRAYTVGRMFGLDLVNQPYPTPNVGSKPKDGTSNQKRLQRSALPAEWISSSKPSSGPLHTSPPKNIFNGSDAMDIDISPIKSAPFLDSSPVQLVLSAAPTVTSFSNLFFEAASPEIERKQSSIGPRKRRSLSPDRSFNDLAPDLDFRSSSPPPPSSPSQRKFERSSTVGAKESLFHKLSKAKFCDAEESSGGIGANKRPRRPTIDALMRPGLVHDPPIRSAYAILDSSGSGKENSPELDSLPAPRRAFSAVMAPQMSNSYASSDDKSFGTDSGEVDMSSPAAQAFAKRQSMKAIRRRDGTEDFRSLTGATALVQKNTNVLQKSSPSSRFFSAGIPGFGDNESHGKILPCCRVAEDGLMRIDCKTLDNLLDGKYNSMITDFCVIDCRFDYEYSGGHIPGAINVSSTSDIEELLLGDGAMKPSPSCSGDPAKKTVLIFHCEFSVKRAPTFAKHLRSKDRAMNNGVYPRIHYPEIYVLSGGYSQYFKESAPRCQPSGYIRMDDPAHANSRREDLDQFRKARFGRTRSYAYGDALTKASLQQQQQKPQRNTIPSGGVNSIFAAATAARTRRNGSGLSTLNEDVNVPSFSEDEAEGEIGDSPCPPPTKNASLMKGKNMSRGPLCRAQTFAPLLR